MGQEFERKYRATPEKLAAIREAFAPFRQIQMETTYYDTPTRQLSQRHWTLRRRMENGVSVCTLKTPGVGDARGEWETEAESITAGIPILCKLTGEDTLSQLTAQGVEAVCGARFTRLAATLTVEGGTVELALDAGVLLGGGKESPLCEVEVERKSGTEGAVLTFGEALAARFGLIPETQSKFKRARDLAAQK